MCKKVLTSGEPMGLFIAQEEALLEDVRHFMTSVAGAEFNVAVGLRRLGFSVGYLTKLGNDPFGRQIQKVMEANGIDTSMTRFTKDHNTGFMLKSKTSHGDPDIYYYRKGSAASTISVEDVSSINWKEWDALHTSGILPATSTSAMDATIYLMKSAREHGKPVFFDPNLRPQLWKSKEIMIKKINHMASLADYVLPGENEGIILCGSKDPRIIAEFYLSKGAKAVIVKVGAEGAWAFTKIDGIHVPSYQHGPIVDTVGAGDGFAVGVESALLEGRSMEEALKRGNAIGTIQIMNCSDNEGLPTREGLEQFMQNTPFAE
ncbi:MAG: sugar kinase [Peptoniphilaceae bacterium]|nr:sugar kinase [Peptoniphilaceae bacterium]